MRKILLLYLFLSLNIILLSAQVAELENFKGPFSVVRNGQQETIREPKFLFQDLDVLLSQEESVALTLNKLTGISAQIVVAPHSAILLSVSSFKEEQTAQVFTLAGQIDVLLHELVGRSRLLVRNSNLIAILSPHGQLVFVSLSARDALVMPLKGSSRVQQAKGTSNVVIARGVVGELLDNKLNIRPVSDITLSGYASAWLTISNQRETTQSERLMRLVLTQQAMFARSMGRLAHQEAIWQKWESEDKASGVGTSAELQEEISAVQGGLIATYPYVIPLLEAFFALESFPAVAENRRSQKVSAEWTAGEFERQLPTFAPRAKRDIWQYLYWLKLYKKRNKGDFFEKGLPRGM